MADDEDTDNEIAAPRQEKRAKPFRASATPDIAARIARAVTQRLYLVDQNDASKKGSLGREYAVLGSTGNLYKVGVCKQSTCNCPDFARFRLCKHIIFVLVKVLRVPKESHLVFQDALLQAELKEIFDNAPPPPGDIQANAAVVHAYNELVGKEDTTAVKEEVKEEEVVAEAVNTKVPEGDCPVCFEDLPNGEALDSCFTCKNFIHIDCLKMWMSRSKTCCYCRCDWRSINDKPKPKAASSSSASTSNDFSYTNMADIQGMSTKRDYSSYKRTPASPKPKKEPAPRKAAAAKATKAKAAPKRKRRKRADDYDDDDDDEEDDE